MALPAFHHESTTGDNDCLAPAAAAVALGLSRGSLDKLTASGILPTPIPVAAVSRLAARPWLRVSSGELTVLRTTWAQEAHDTEAPRPYIGFRTDFTNEELEAASLRWWRGESDRLLDNQLFAVSIGTIPVAVYELTKVVDREQNNREVRCWYAGELLARVEAREAVSESRAQGTIVDAFTELVWVVTSPQPRNHPLFGRAMEIMGSRVSASSGGPIGYLNADTK